MDWGRRALYSVSLDLVGVCEALRVLQCRRRTMSLRRTERTRQSPPGFRRRCAEAWSASPMPVEGSWQDTRKVSRKATFKHLPPKTSRNRRDVRPSPSRTRRLQMPPTSPVTRANCSTPLSQPPSNRPRPAPEAPRWGRAVLRVHPSSASHRYRLRHGSRQTAHHALRRRRRRRRHQPSRAWLGPDPPPGRAVPRISVGSDTLRTGQARSTSSGRASGSSSPRAASRKTLKMPRIGAARVSCSSTGGSSPSS